MQTKACARPPPTVSLNKTQAVLDYARLTYVRARVYDQVFLGLDPNPKVTGPFWSDCGLSSVVLAASKANVSAPVSDAEAAGVEQTTSALWMSMCSTILALNLRLWAVSSVQVSGQNKSGRFS